jgi:Raf kinase inhibitor-like YbhB/YbcL family protein
MTLMRNSPESPSPIPRIVYRTAKIAGMAVVLLSVTILAGPGGGAAVAFELKSPAFSEGDHIAKKHTCDGGDVSVPLEWSDPPPATKGFALIADDPDAPAGTWVHWVLYDLPAKTRRLDEGLSAKEAFPDGSMQGVNSFRRIGYGGPCPPPGRPHRYYFKLYALDKKTGLPPKATKAQLMEAIKNHTLEHVELMGRYGR